jgi:hypothetical protein
MSSLTPKAACKMFGGYCFSPVPTGTHQMIARDQNSFDGTLSKRIEGFSTSGYFSFKAKAISREAFNVSFLN